MPRKETLSSNSRNVSRLKHRNMAHNFLIPIEEEVSLIYIEPLGRSFQLTYFARREHGNLDNNNALLNKQALFPSFSKKYVLT